MPVAIAPVAAPQQHGKRRKSTRARVWVWMAMLLTIAGFYVYHTRTQAGSRAEPNPIPTPPPVIVHTAVARTGRMGIYLSALGTVTPVSTVNVYSQISGQIVAVHYREGEMIHQGDALIDIDPRPYQAQLQQVQGTLEHDRGLLRQAQIDLARYRQAFALHAVAKQLLDDQEQAVVQYEGSMKNDMGQVEYAQVQLGYCHIVAPASGKVGLRLIDRGNTVFAGGATPLVVVTQLQPITVVFNVSEDHVAEVERELRRQGSLRGSIRVDALDRSAQSELATGTLRALDNEIDTATGTLRLRATFRNEKFTLFPNQFVNARLLLRTLEGAVLVPTEAIQRNGAEAFIYVVQEQKNGYIVTVHPIIEEAADGAVTAVAGLPPGTVIATSGFEKLEEGATVTVEGSPRPVSAAEGHL